MAIVRLTGHESSSIETETESNAVSFEHRSITLLPIERMRNVESASVLNTIEYGVKPEKKGMKNHGLQSLKLHRDLFKTKRDRLS